MSSVGSTGRSIPFALIMLGLVSCATFKEDRAYSPSTLDRFCEQGETQACFRLGSAYALGEGVQKSARLAAKFFERGCEQGDVDSCFHAVRILGHKTTARAARAFVCAEYGCDLQSGASCAQASSAHARGRGTRKDENKAFAQLRKACDLRFAAGCTSLGLVHLKGWYGKKRSVDQAARLLKKACALKDGRGCFQLAWLYDDVLAHEDKTGVLHFQALKHACDLKNVDGCADLGVAYSHGVGVARNPTRSAKLYEEACAQGHRGACANFGERLIAGNGIGKDVARGLALLKENCSKGSASACDNLGWVFQMGKGGVSVDDEVALAYRLRACERGSFHSCVRAANQSHFDPQRYKALLEKEKIIERGFLLAERGCDSGQGKACWVMSEFYRGNTGKPMDLAKARDFDRRGCENGWRLACQRQTRSLLKDHVPDVELKARMLDLRARCKRGNSYDCNTAALVLRALAHDDAAVLTDALHHASAACIGRLVDGCENAAALSLRLEPKNLSRAIMFLRNACNQAGASDACERLAQTLVRRDRKGDRLQAVAALKPGCDDLRATHCRMMAGLVFGDRAVPTTDDLKTLILTGLCRNSFLECGRAAALAAQGRAPPGIHKQVKTHWQRLCDAGEGRACRSLARRLAEDDEAPKNARKATLLLERSCTLGHAKGCKSLARRYKAGPAATRDLEAARETYERLCSVHQECWYEADFAARGIGGSKNTERAAKIWREGCLKKKDTDACYSIGKLITNGELASVAPAEGIAFLRRACRAGKVKNCQRLLTAIAENLTAPALESTVAAAANEEHPSLLRAALLFEPRLQLSTAVRKKIRLFMLRDCRHDVDGAHCTDTSVALANGWFGPEYTAVGARLHEERMEARAVLCRQGLATECNNLAWLLVKSTRPELAIPFARRSLLLNPYQEGNYGPDTLSVALFLVGDVEEAIAVTKRYRPSAETALAKRETQFLNGRDAVVDVA